MIQDTSLEIYLKEVYPSLRARQRPVLHYLRNAGGAHTNAEIATALAKPINEITPRTFELRKLGLVLEAGRRRCKVTGNAAKVWIAKHPVLPPAREIAPQQTNSLGI
jgi:hypothetical protein